LLKVALDRHRILMLKNKIYKYLSREIFTNFVTILLTFTAIAWTVRAVNFLDLMIIDGYSASIYFKYTLLNISTIITRFVPLSFLLSMIIAISKFERQQELMILWTAGLNKINITNLFLLISFVVVFIQIVLGLIINPFSLNKSRTLLRESEIQQVGSILKSGDFSDSFDGITFYIDKKNLQNELINIFIQDNNGSLKTIVSEAGNAANTTIYAKKGFVDNNKLILFNGTIQTLSKKNEIDNIDFKKTELSIDNFSTRTIKQPKIQETSSYDLFQCLFGSSKNRIIQNCNIENKSIVIETLSRRIGMPLYIPLISIISSFLLIYKKEKKYNYLKKYFVFSLAFLFLIFAEIFLRYTGFAFINFFLYLTAPLLLFVFFYFLLIKNISYEGKI